MLSCSHRKCLDNLVSYAPNEAAVIHDIVVIGVIDGGNLISLMAVLQYTGI